MLSANPHGSDDEIYHKISFWTSSTSTPAISISQVARSYAQARSLLSNYPIFPALTYLLANFSAHFHASDAKASTQAVYLWSGSQHMIEKDKTTIQDIHVFSTLSEKSKPPY